MRRLLFRRYHRWLIYLVVESLLFVFLADIIIVQSTKSRIFTDVNNLPTNNCALLLGTGKTLKSGQPNEFFVNRIEAAMTLYRAGKISYIVVSGDNHIQGYNEPQDMKDALVQAGFPADSIYMDYAGFRTYDSVIRMWKIFGQTQFTIISQAFHLRRAIYIASQFDLDVVGYTAKDVKAYNGFMTKVREKFARVKVFIDLIFNKSPKFLGETVSIP